MLSTLSLWVFVVNLILIVDGGHRRVYFREVAPTTSEGIIRRTQRGVIAPLGYQNRVVEQQLAANQALEDASQSNQAAQILADSLRNSILIRQQLQQDSKGPGAGQGGIRLVDQYGNDVTNRGVETLQLQQPQPQQVSGPSGGYSYPALQQKVQPQQETPPNNGYLPPQLQQQPQQQATAPQYFITQEGTIFVQQQPQPPLVYAQPQPAAVPLVEPHVHHHLPLPHYHNVHLPLVQPHQHQFLIPQPQPLAVIQKEIITPALIPQQTVKLVKQPIIPPAVFQKEIFAIKNPPVRVLTYSDLCTVYPYQSKLSACAYKKAAIPELHHPDVQLVPERERGRNNNGNRLPEIDPRNNNGNGVSTRLNLDNGGGDRDENQSSEERNDDGRGSSILDILKDAGRGGAKALSKDSQEDSEGEEGIVNDNDRNAPANVAESSNTKENVVLKANIAAGRTKNGVAASKVSSRKVTALQIPPSAVSPPPGPETESESRGQKRRSRRNKSRKSKSRRNKNNGNSTRRKNNDDERKTTSTSRPFLLV